MPVFFVIYLLVFAVHILIMLVARLMKSYPLVWVGLFFLVVSSVLAILLDKQELLGVTWLVLGAASAIAAGLYFIKNIKGAFWWSLGATLGMIGAAAVVGLGLKGEVLALAIPFGIFIVIGLLGSLIVPRLIHKDRAQRKHLTNVDPLIGKRVKIIKDKDGENAARALIGDVDWAVEPLYKFETFKLGDVLKVERIKGVTLLCTRDGKDYRKELREKRKAEKEAYKQKEEERRKAKAAKKAEKEAAKAAQAKEEPKVEEVKEEKPVVKEEPKVVEVKEEPKVVEEPKVEEPKVEEPAPQPKEKAEFVPFAVRLAQADPFVRDSYNELKSEVLSYGIKSRISSTGDTFRLHTKTYVKMVVAGKYLKLYLALNPKDYKDTTYPFEDASRMGAHKDTPFVFKIKSGLSVRRAKVLIGDAAKKDELPQKEVVAHNHAADVKVEK